MDADDLDGILMFTQHFAKLVQFFDWNSSSCKPVIDLRILIGIDSKQANGSPSLTGLNLTHCWKRFREKPLETSVLLRILPLPDVVVARNRKQPHFTGSNRVAV